MIHSNFAADISIITLVLKYKRSFSFFEKKNIIKKNLFQKCFSFLKVHNESFVFKNDHFFPKIKRSFLEKKQSEKRSFFQFFSKNN